MIGSSTFAAGALLKGTKYMLPLMLLGRLIFGSGNGSLTSKYHAWQTDFKLDPLTNCVLCVSGHLECKWKIVQLVLFQLFSVVQNRITSFWFKDKELAMAFGITLAFSRLGSVLNFFLTANFEHEYGLQWTLWGGMLRDSKMHLH